MGLKPGFKLAKINALWCELIYSARSVQPQKKAKFLLHTENWVPSEIFKVEQNWAVCFHLHHLKLAGFHCILKFYPFSPLLATPLSILVCLLDSLGVGSGGRSEFVNFSFLPRQRVTWCNWGACWDKYQNKSWRINIGVMTSGEIFLLSDCEIQ